MSCPISRREKEILHCIAFEKNTREIAKELYISEHTVVTHRKNLLHKMEVKNSAGLIRKAFELGLLRLNKHVVALATIILFTSSLSTSYSQCHQLDFQALKALYDSTNGDGWTDTTGWTMIRNHDICPEGFSLGDAHGVTMDVSNKRVEMLQLNTNNLVGTLPLAFFELRHLQKLELHANSISSTIPSNISNLKKLFFLNLNGNNLSGEIPTELTQLPELNTLIIGHNYLSGEIPKSINQLTKLSNFNVSGNALSDSIPSELGQLSNLLLLNLSNNSFDGPIPAELGDLQALITINLQNNSLSGSYPPNLKNLCSVTTSNSSISDGNSMDADWSDFCASDAGVCACDESDFAALKALYNSTNGDSWSNNTGWTTVKNNVTCPLGFDLGTLYGIGKEDIYGRVDSIRLRNNGLSGTIPDEIGNMEHLRIFNLSKNAITGDIPDTLGSISTLTNLKLHENQLTDASIPTNGFPNLKIYSLNNNNLTGGLPSGMGDITTLEEIWLSNNTSLGGTLPEEIGFLEHLNTLRIGNCNLSGCFPFSWLGLCDKLTNTEVHEQNNLNATYSLLCAGSAQHCDNSSHTTKIFTGNKDNDWDDIFNWNTLSLPVAGDTVIILEDRVVNVNTTVNIKHLIIQETAEVNILDGNTMTVENADDIGIINHGSLNVTGTLNVKSCDKEGIYSYGPIHNEGTMYFTDNLRTNIFSLDSLVNNDSLLIEETHSTGILSFGDVVNSEDGYIRVFKVTDDFGNSYTGHDAIVISFVGSSSYNDFRSDASLTNYGTIEIDSINNGIHNFGYGIVSNHGFIMINNAAQGLSNLGDFIGALGSSIIIECEYSGLGNNGYFENHGVLSITHPGESYSTALFCFGQSLKPAHFVNEATGIASVKKADSGLRLYNYTNWINYGNTSISEGEIGLTLSNLSEWNNMTGSNLNINECSDNYVDIEVGGLLIGMPIIEVSLDPGPE